MTRKSFKAAIFALVIGVVLIGTLAAAAADSVIDQANALYSRRAKQADAVDDGIALLEKHLGGQPNDYEALWRLARFYWYKGDHQPEGKKIALFEKGKTFAERAVSANAKGVEGHYWFASLIGSVGQEKGILNSLFMVKPMKEQLDICLELDPKHYDALSVMARLYWKVPGPPLSIGNKKKALELIKKSTDINPQSISNWVYYGEIAMANKEYALARKALNTAISLPDDDEDPKASQKDKAKAKELLKEIEGK